MKLTLQLLNTSSRFGVFDVTTWIAQICTCFVNKVERTFQNDRCVHRKVLSLLSILVVGTN